MSYRNRKAKGDTLELYSLILTTHFNFLTSNVSKYPNFTIYDNKKVSVVLGHLVKMVF